MSTMITTAQIKLWFNKISETEIDPKFIAGCNTMEGYVKNFIEKFGNNEFDNVLRLIETNKINAYIDNLKLIGKKKSIDEANDIIAMIRVFNKCKLYFIVNSKLYVITYDKSNYTSLYLYRRDVDGWRVASDLIREDDYQFKEFMRRYESRTTKWNERDTLYNIENQFFGNVYKISNGSIFITFTTEIWYPQGNGYMYNSILVFIPNDNETYRVSCFEPENRYGKILKDITNHTYNWNKHTWSTSKISAKFPVLYGNQKIEYVESNDGNGLTIKYWDGTTDNPILAGTINFNIMSDTYVAFKTKDILLNQVK